VRKLAAVKTQFWRDSTMTTIRSSRRQFLKTSAGLAGMGATLPSWIGDLSYGAERRQEPAANDTFGVGAIGVGGQGTNIARQAGRLGKMLAVCDVDRRHAERAREAFKNELGVEAEIFEDYRKLLERQDIQVVTVGTPDHWHTRICIDAMKAGKDVYCEKPLTLTIREGQLLVKTAQETGRIMQVGTQQRSEMGPEGNWFFLRAVATVRSGRLGKMQKITASLPLSTQEGGPFEPKPVPEGFNWDLWLGQAPLADYCPERSHFTFRWWYEYSGGIGTDWGAHHMDIVQWALDKESSGPITADGSATKLPAVPNGFNTPKELRVLCTYEGGAEVQITTGDEGILFEGERGRIYVNRGRVAGLPFEEQDNDTSVQDQIHEQMAKLYKGKKPGSHMRNFFEAVQSREQPVSDVASQHRSVSACHIANISARLQRKVSWDPANEEFVGDDEANAMRTRHQRSPYEVEA
jgi:predicted dehydrogenase